MLAVVSLKKPVESFSPDATSTWQIRSAQALKFAQAFPEIWPEVDRTSLAYFVHNVPLLKSTKTYAEEIDGITLIHVSDTFVRKNRITQVCTSFYEYSKFTTDSETWARFSISECEGQLIRLQDNRQLALTSDDVLTNLKLITAQDKAKFF